MAQVAPSYLWTPATGLASTTIPDPVGNYDGSFDNIRYKLIVPTRPVVPIQLM